MAAHQTLADLYGPMLQQLEFAMLQDDSEAFHATLESIRDARADDVTRELRVLAETLHDAMLKFRHEFRISDLADRDVPDARARLNHVMTLTDEAAHKTMDLVEQCGPFAERTARGAAGLAAQLRDSRTGAQTSPDDPLLDRVQDFLVAATGDCDRIRANLAEVMLAQTYQDLTGQIIRGVVTLVGDVERVLGELMRMTGVRGRKPTAAQIAPATNHGFGPAIPGVSQGVVQGQTDIDDLMADLGI